MHTSSGDSIGPGDAVLVHGFYAGMAPVGAGHAIIRTAREPFIVHVDSVSAVRATPVEWVLLVHPEWSAVGLYRRSNTGHSWTLRFTGCGDSPLDEEDRLYGTGFLAGLLGVLGVKVRSRPDLYVGGHQDWPETVDADRMGV